MSKRNSSLKTNYVLVELTPSGYIQYGNLGRLVTCHNGILLDKVIEGLYTEFVADLLPLRRTKDDVVARIERQLPNEDWTIHSLLFTSKQLSEGFQDRLQLFQDCYGRIRIDTL